MPALGRLALQEAWETILKAVDAIQARKPPVTRATRLTLPAELRIIRAK